MRHYSKLFTSAILSLLLTVLLQLAPLSAMALAQPKQMAHTDQSTVIVKLKAGSDVQLVNGAFAVATNASDTDAALLNNTLASTKITQKKALIHDSKQSIQAHRSLSTIALPQNQADLDNYYTLSIPAGETADSVAQKLKRIGAVETAYAKPLPAPAPTTADYSVLQKYLSAAPTGMGVRTPIGGVVTNSVYPGTYGGSIQLADLEYSWDTSHEDLASLRVPGAAWNNGTPVDPYSNNNHGTAVAGIIAASHNNSGVEGVVPLVQYHMVNTDNVERGWDLANSIYTATNQMKKGDVIVIEQQAWAPDSLGYAPVEVYPDVYDAISYATADGITVVEPAGNGNLSATQGYDLSDPMFNGEFTTRASSGAIMVGAGAAGCAATPIHARMPFSNYGARIDVQGYGECVTTTGYGDLYYGNADATYTANFSGTSSASATIAGIVSELSSSYLSTNGVALTPAKIKTLLQTGGSAQNNSVNPGNIGVLPNLAVSLPHTDITRPTQPTKLIGASTAPNRITLTWKASTDNLGYVRYVVYRNNIRIASTTKPVYIDTSVRAKTTFTYKLYAVDGSNNLSLVSNSVIVRNR
jgi:serine protease